MLADNLVMPELVWWSVPVGEDGMQKLNVHAFYLIGGAIQVNYLHFAGIDQI
jgi:hypothetical protein